jgi:hypothetical protein
MPVQRLFVAHRSPPKDTNARIDAILAHHALRGRRVLEILGESPAGKSAFEVALRLEWSVSVPLLEAHPLQRWLVCSEALAHLQSLRFDSLVTCRDEDGVLRYSLEA